MNLKQLETAVAEVRSVLDAQLGGPRADDIEITSLVGAEHFGDASDEGDQMFALSDLKVEISALGEDTKVWFE